MDANPGDWLTLASKSEVFTNWIKPVLPLYKNPKKGKNKGRVGITNIDFRDR
jgi:hypothetical protein